MAASLAGAATHASYGVVDSNPAWSPDGRFVAFVRGPSWHVVRQDGSGLRSLRTPAFQWTADGRRMVLRRGKRLYVAAADGAGARLLSEADVYGFDVAPDGRHVAYGGDRIVVVDLADGSARTVTAVDGAPLRPRYDLWPQWSPDGRRLLFVRTYTPDGYHGVYHAYVVGAEGSGQRPLVEDSSGYEVGASWSPDGRWIAIWEDWGDEPELSVVPSTGGKKRLIGQATSSAWAPTGRYLAFEVGEERPTVEVARADGHPVAALGRGRFETWSHDGRGLVIARDGMLDLFSPRGRLVRRLGPGEEAAFAPDGRLAYTIGCGERQGLWVARGDLSDARRLTDECRIAGQGRLQGTAGHDVITGSDGDDIVFGHAGRDEIDGREGADALHGGAGDDWIVSADRWRDLVTCGPGRDRVRADGADDVRGDCEAVTSR